MADTYALGAYAERRESSSLSEGTKEKIWFRQNKFLYLVYTNKKVKKVL